MQKTRIFTDMCGMEKSMLNASGDCYHRLTGQHLREEDINDSTEPEVVKFLSHKTWINSWRLVTA